MESAIKVILQAAGIQMRSHLGSDYIYWLHSDLRLRVKSENDSIEL
jgi:hypothetical protein